MLLIHLKTGLRTLLKRKTYSLLNVLGLTIGMACCLLIFHYVSYERSYDTHIPDNQNLYRLRLDSYQNGELAWKSATVYPAIAPYMEKDYPEVESFSRLIDANVLLTNSESNISFRETKGYYGEQSFFETFGLSLAEGKPETALTGPGKIIISEKMAKKYFGTTHVLGKTLQLKEQDENQTFEISGVFTEFPKNSHLDIEYIISWDTFRSMIARQWGDTSNPTETSFGWYDFYAYLKLKPNTDYKQLEAKFPDFCKTYMDPLRGPAVRHELSLIPVTDIHLYSNYNQEAEINGNGQMVSFLFLIAIFIIGIAWINYINLASARSIERAKEVGVKKVLGAFRTDLIRQFLVENFLLNTVSLVFAMIIFFILLRPFDLFTGRAEFTGVTLSPMYWILFVAIFMAGTLLSGIYPALVLSAFQPIKVLKGVFKNSGGGIGLRKSLIVVQFVISVVLIAGTIIVYQQVQFMRKKDLGVDIKQTLVLNGATSQNDSVYAASYEPFKSALLQIPGIKLVTTSTNVMGQEIYWTNGSRKLNEPKESAVTLYNMAVDHDFVKAYDMKLKGGRAFSEDITADKKCVMLNESAVKLLGFKSVEEAINSKIQRQRDTFTVVGIVADYHHEGLQRAILPMIILRSKNIRNFYSLKLETDNVTTTIAQVREKWNTHFPSDPFDYFFLDDTYNAQYKSDVLFGKVFSVFAFLAILIACSGLVGLSAYNIQQRSKEIGIRKVLGATAENILILLSKDFMKLVAISFLIAIPVGWYIMNMWLQDFAYRISINWWVFVAAGIIAFAIAVITIVMQAYKAVVENPVKSLRSE